MRAAFAEDDAASGKAADPDEASAMAAVREAFGEATVPVGGSTHRQSSTSGGKGTMNGGSKPSAPSPSPAASKRRETTTGETDTWLQGQVDQLVGEVQRLARGPFTRELLTMLWNLPLEDQQEVLLGATGTVSTLAE